MDKTNKEKLSILLSSISTKIVLILIALVLPLNLLLLWLTIDTNRTLRHQAVAASESILRRRLAEWEKELGAIDLYLLEMLESNTDFTRFVLQSTEDSYVLGGNKLHFAFGKKLGFSNMEMGLFAIRNEPHLLRFRYSTGAPDAEIEPLRLFLDNMEKDAYTGKWQLVEIDGADYLLHIFSRREGRIGAIIPAGEMLASLSEEFGYEGIRLVVFDEMGGAQSSAEDGELYVSSLSPQTGIGIELYLPENEILNSLPMLQRLAFYFALASLLIVPLLFYILYRILVKPLLGISHALQRLEKGELDFRIAENSHSSEFRYVNESFNRMSAQIQSLKIENYEQELQKQFHELKSLQLQIRPHFLFNLFNLIHNMASLEDYSNIQNLTRLMTEYFRYSIRTGYDKVPLSKELSFLDTYCRIAQIRYPDCFSMDINIPPRLYEFPIPPLMLHTFVENIFQHTVRMGMFVNIGIELFEKDGRIYIVISDDGEGMAEEQLLEIKRRLAEDDMELTEHIGIWNCKKRLDIIYAGQGDLDISSRLSEGTRITISLPVKEIQNDNSAV